MPELPEVEVTCQAIRPFLCLAKIKSVTVRQRQLRWPVPENLEQCLRWQSFLAVSRRGKYILLQLKKGTLICHLGMSGCLRIVDTEQPPRKHDHLDILFSDNKGQEKCLRFHDPRRFGAVLWTEQAAEQHRLLSHLGVEPLSDDYNAEYLLAKASSSRLPVKAFLMNHKIVVGIGNIYAAESLFAARIDPLKPVREVSKKEFMRLIKHSRRILQQAIAQGGTTFRDFLQPEGKPGYFTQVLNVYGRAGQECTVCQNTLQQVLIAGRSTVYCHNCQS